MTVLFDKNNRILLHRRKHALFDGLWDLTAISHPLWIDGRNESYQEASDRALLKEMGIAHVPVEKIGSFNYFARDGENCENEYCAVLIGKYNGETWPNKNEVYEAKKVDFGKFLDDLEKNPQKYTPWTRLAAKQIVNRLPARLASKRVGEAGKSLIVNRIGTNTFKRELEKFLRVFETYSKQYFAHMIKNSAKYPPLIGRFYRDLFEFSLGGKKLRAFLVWLGYKVGTGPVSSFSPAYAEASVGRPASKDSAAVPLEAKRSGAGILSTTATRSEKFTEGLKKILPIALAVEIIHDFLLIHDDIIDQSDRRRGKSTIHKRYERLFGQHYGLSQAILLGDIVCFEALKLINMADFEDDLKIAVQKRLVEVLLETVYGEALDVEYSYRQSTPKKIRQMIELKSAKYTFVGPLKIGATLAGASKSQIEALTNFGLSTGTAFQLQDDILGLFGDEKVIGKSTLSDLREGKNTLLIYKTRELAKSGAQKVLNRLWGKRDADWEELKRVRQIITDCGVLAWCEQEKERLIQRAKGYVDKVTKDEKLKGVFFELCDFVIEREK